MSRAPATNPVDSKIGLTSITPKT